MLLMRAARLKPEEVAIGRAVIFLLFALLLLVLLAVVDLVATFFTAFLAAVFLAGAAALVFAEDALVIGRAVAFLAVLGAAFFAAGFFLAGAFFALDSTILSLGAAFLLFVVVFLFAVDLRAVADFAIY